MAHQPSYTYKTGLGNSAAYQVSGTPFVSGTINACVQVRSLPISFPRVTQWVTFTNNDTNGRTLKVAFSQNGLENDTALFEIHPSQSMDILPFKVTEVWLTGSNRCSVVAGLTSVEVDQVNNSSVSPSGSFQNWSGSIAAHVG